MPISIEFEHIESALQALPIQNRTMIQLLLLQYIDVTQEEIDYMATDQPDSRFMAGKQPQGKTISLEAVQDVTSRSNQYKGYYRQKRERPGMHVEFLKQSLAIIGSKNSHCRTHAPRRFYGRRRDDEGCKKSSSFGSSPSGTS